jgi:lipase (class 3)
VISDLEIAQLLQQLYSGSTGFDHYEPGSGGSGICWALKKTSDTDIILLRGSTTFQDWARDLIALAAPFSHSVFGPVHPGFEIGMERAWENISGYVDPRPGRRPWIVAGHSLGAGRAAILTALAVECAQAPAARVVFGEPKPGFKRLAEYIAHVPARSYRNTGEVSGRSGHDLITDVPLSFPPEEYVHDSSLIDVSAPPAAGDNWGPFAYHHMELYVSALGKSCAPGGNVVRS